MAGVKGASLGPCALQGPSGPALPTRSPMRRWVHPGAPLHGRAELMKVMSRWATVGFAVLAFVLGGAIGWVAVEIAVPASPNFNRSSDGLSTAVGGLVSNSVIVVVLVLASMRSRSNVLAYL